MQPPISVNGVFMNGEADMMQIRYWKIFSKNFLVKKNERMHPTTQQNLAAYGNCDVIKKTSEIKLVIGFDLF